MRLLWIAHRAGRAMGSAEDLRARPPWPRTRYRRYHADLFDGQEVSCWEKHLVEQEIVRMTARAA